MMKKIIIFLIFPWFICAGVNAPKWISGTVVTYDKNKVTLLVKGVDGGVERVVVLRKSVVVPANSDKLQTGKKVYSIRSLAFSSDEQN